MAKSSASRSWAVGGLVFAATMMIMLGIWEVFVGIAAIVNDEFFVVGPNYTYDIDTTAWGWIHLILGALAALAGFFLFTGATWARAVGIGLAALVAINNFIFLPYYPLWSLAMIALAVFVIWSMATARTDRFDDSITGERSGYYSNAGGEPRPAPDRWPTNRPAGQHRTDQPAPNGQTANGVEQVTEHPPVGRG
ncbi:DUF7144 family membrane protein [Phytohabitans houttuyneae]|jgi:hypothetical protein|uniref:DUF7144 domain-containing protein n=1 Tax=Phytohabitans houttuyneae TaxID=1076126 RepID=A0A6V8JZU3_9ACTN|nr:hypothetical protein [Phytohabitans houttuyneae]GFJ76780.1 hypothetical protein Phou_009600 [Phytohabitans houttuyneae]